MTADATFVMAGQLVNEAQGKPYEDRLKALQVLMPLALKRIPDKQEIRQLTINASPEDVAKMIQLAEANLLARKRLQQEPVPHSPPDRNNPNNTNTGPDYQK
jgi:hypothetical protein